MRQRLSLRDNTKESADPPGGCPLTGGPSGVGSSGAQGSQQERMQREQNTTELGDREEIIVETINITSLKANQSSLLERAADVVLVQEHGIGDKLRAAAEDATETRGWHAEFGPIDPEHQRPSDSDRLWCAGRPRPP